MRQNKIDLTSLLLREPIVALFIEHPTKEIIVYSNGYLNWVSAWRVHWHGWVRVHCLCRFIII